MTEREILFASQILPLIQKHKIIYFNKTDARLANNGLPIWLQKLRCRVNYQALRFTPKIEALGNKLVSILQKTGSFVVLHLRYEMDMLAFSGCTHGCSDIEAEELTRMRFDSWSSGERIYALMLFHPRLNVLSWYFLCFLLDMHIHGGRRKK